ncbi:ribonuclease J [bacterium]|nr:ribonuclease J [bacterium]
MNPSTHESNLSPDHDNDRVRIIPFGGCGEFGMNLTGYLFRDKLFVVDCGVMFPDPSKLGVDAIYPHIDPWFEQFGGVHAYLITHGHEDHIGALPYVLDRWPAPVYATPWTASLIESKFERRKVAGRFPVTRVSPGDRIQFEDVKIDWVPVNHSIPMASALLMDFDGKTVFHTGDFRIDFERQYEPPMDLSRIREIGDKGVDLLIADSTNSHRPGLGPSEFSVLGPLGDLMADTPGAVIITTFASNYWRVRSIANLCAKFGKKLLILGGGFEQAIRIGGELGFDPLPDGIMAPQDQVGLGNIPRDKLVVLASGSQGEWRSALSRLSNDEHRGFKVAPGDTVIFSSRIIPGNEKSVLWLMNNFQRRGVRVVTSRETPGIHVSGHAYRGEIKTLVEHVRPKTFIPMHGTFTHLDANESIISELGLDDTATLLMEDGDIVDLTSAGCEFSGRIEVETLYVDADSHASMTKDVLRERLRIGEGGCAFVTGVFDAGGSRWLRSPEIILQGIEFRPEEGHAGPVDKTLWLEEASMYVADAIVRLAAQQPGATPADIDEEARLTLRRLLFGSLNRKPQVFARVHCLG